MTVYFPYDGILSVLFHSSLKSFLFQSLFFQSCVCHFSLVPCVSIFPALCQCIPGGTLITVSSIYHVALHYLVSSIPSDIVCAAPEAIKSLMLKFVEQLHSIESLDVNSLVALLCQLLCQNCSYLA